MLKGLLPFVTISLKHCTSSSVRVGKSTLVAEFVIAIAVGIKVVMEGDDVGMVGSKAGMEGK